MEASTQIILSGALTFGVPLLFACRELIVLRRGRGGSWGGDPAPDPQPVPPPDKSPPDAIRPDDRSQHAGPSRPLPECLIPRPWSNVPQRPRIPELV